MSQFFGCISLNNKQNVTEIGQKMQKSLSFVNENKIGFYEKDNIFICNKLIINRPESINTPLICENERYVLAASVRLDNRNELSEILQIDIKKSDHEFLLASFILFKEDCVKHLIGDFSFVVWDKHTNNLFLAKDHLGIRPLFYYKNEDLFLFSTSITAIKAVFDKPLKISELYIAYELKGYQMPVELTFFEDLKRLKPAHYLNFSLTEGLNEEQQYWELQQKDISKYKTEKDKITEMRRLFEEAVKCRTNSVKNIGCQLSGGLDSSAITVQVSRTVHNNKLHTYSFVLNDKTKEYSEKKLDGQKDQNLIIEFANLNRSNHHNIEEFHFKDIFEELHHRNLIMGGLANSDAVWETTMYKEAEKNNIGIIFSGFPGDECLSNNGNRYYYDYIFFKNWGMLFQFIKKRKLKAIIEIGIYYYTKHFGIYFFQSKSKINKRLLLNINSKFQNVIKNSFETFYPTFKLHLKNQICRAHTCLRSESEGAYALQFGIETVYPLADIRLLEFTYSLPTEIFIPEPMPRIQFRKMCEGLLPDIIRNQSKLGAITVAFAEFWKKKKIAEINNYTLVNTFEMINTKFNDKNEVRELKGKEVDFLIELNK